MAERATTEGGGMPPTLRGILLARISALPEAAQSVVGVAAVAGRRVDHDLLAAVAGQDETTTIGALREAVGQQVLVAETSGTADGYAFRHALMQEAAYDDLLPGERRRLHRAFAEAVAAQVAGTGADAAGYWAELTHHWSAARDDARALEASVRAAHAAVEAYAFADAVRHYETALDLWSGLDDPEAVADVDLATLLDAASTIASLDGPTRLWAALREAAIAELDADADPVRAALWLERLGRARWLAADTVGALRAYDDSMAMVDRRATARARVLSGYGQLLMLLDRWDESRLRCEEALALARAAGDRQVEGHALCTLGLDYAALGRSVEGVASLEEAHRIAVDIGNDDDVGRSSVNLANALLYVGEPERAAIVVRDRMAEAQALASPAHTAATWPTPVCRCSTSRPVGGGTRTRHERVRLAAPRTACGPIRVGPAGAAAGIGRRPDGRSTARPTRAPARGRTRRGPVLRPVSRGEGRARSLARPAGGGAGGEPSRARRGRWTTIRGIRFGCCGSQHAPRPSSRSPGEPDAIERSRPPRVRAGPRSPAMSRGPGMTGRSRGWRAGRTSRPRRSSPPSKRNGAAWRTSRKRTRGARRSRDWNETVDRTSSRMRAAPGRGSPRWRARARRRPPMGPRGLGAAPRRTAIEVGGARPSPSRRQERWRGRWSRRIPSG